MNQRVHRLIGLCLIVFVLAACATTHTIETTDGRHIQVRESGDFLDQPMTVGGYLALAGVTLAIQLVLILSTRTTGYYR